jgi:hypothetical protein
MSPLLEHTYCAPQRKLSRAKTTKSCHTENVSMPKILAQSRLDETYVLTRKACMSSLYLSSAKISQGNKCDAFYQQIHGPNCSLNVFGHVCVDSCETIQTKLCWNHRLTNHFACNRPMGFQSACKAQTLILAIANLKVLGAIYFW